MSKFDPYPTEGKELAEYWNAIIKATLHWRDNLAFNGAKLWEAAYAIDRGDHYKRRTRENSSGGVGTKADSPNEVITINSLNSTLEDFLAFYVRQAPEFLVKPERRGDDVVRIARNQTKVLNYLFKEQDITEEVVLSLRDWLLIGHNVIKTGFERLFNPNVASDEEGRVVYGEYVKKEFPWGDRVDPRRFLIDPFARKKDLETSRWCAELIVEPIGQIVSDTRYDQDVLSKVKDGTYGYTTYESFITNYQGLIQKNAKNDPAAALGFKLQVLERETLTFKWEIWDRKFEKRIVLLDGCEEPLLNEDWPYPYLDGGFPYSFSKLMPMAELHYPPGMFLMVGDLQLELDRAVTKQFTHHRMYSRKYVANRDKVKQSEASKIHDPDDSVIWFTDDGSPSPPFSTLPDAPISIDTQRVLNTIDQYWMQLTGRDAVISGANLPSRTTAGEVEMRGRVFGIKAERRSEKVDKLFTKVGRQILQHVQANARLPFIVPVLGEKESQFAFEAIEPFNIKGEFGLSVVPVSREPIDPALDRAQTMQFLQTVLQIAAVTQGKVNIPKLLDSLARKFNIPDVDEWFRFEGEEEVQIQGEPGGVNNPPTNQADSVRQQGQQNAGGSDITEALLGTLLGGGGV